MFEEEVTVTLQDALTPGFSFDVAVMTAVPVFFAVTFPLLTEATAELLLLQITALLVALEGDMDAVSVRLSLTARETDDLLRRIFVTLITGAGLTVTFMVLEIGWSPVKETVI